MTKLDDRTMEDMSKLMLDRTTDSMHSVLQLVPDPVQKSEMILMLATLCIGMAAGTLSEAFTADTGKTVSYETFVLFVSEKICDAAVDMGKEVAEIGIDLTRSAVH